MVTISADGLEEAMPPPDLQITRSAHVRDQPSLVHDAASLPDMGPRSSWMNGHSTTMT